MELWEPKRKCPKVVPRYLQNQVLWSWTLKCSVKSYVTGASTKCYFNEFLFMRVLTHDKNRMNWRLWAFEVPWSPGSMLGLTPIGGFWKQSRWPWNMIHSMPCRNPCKLYIHLAFTCSIGRSSVVWSLGLAPPFPPIRALLKVYWTRALSLVCEVALSVTKRSRKYCSSQSHSLKILFIVVLFILTLFTDKHVFVYKCFYHSKSILEHALIFLKCMVNEHVFMNLVSLNKSFNPH